MMKRLLRYSIVLLPFLAACVPASNYPANPYALRQAADAAIQATEQARNERLLAVTVEAARTQMALSAQATQAWLDTAATQRAQQDAARQATATAVAQADARATAAAVAAATATAAPRQTAQAQQAELRRLQAEKARREAEIALWTGPLLKVFLTIASLAMAFVLVWGAAVLLRVRYRLMQERAFGERVRTLGDGVYTIIDPENGEVHFAQPGRAYAPIVRVHQGIQAAAVPEPYQGRTTALDQMRAVLGELTHLEGSGLGFGQAALGQMLSSAVPGEEAANHPSPQVLYLPASAPEVRPILDEVRPYLLSLSEEE